MNYLWASMLSCLALFLGMIAIAYLGHTVSRRITLTDESQHASMGSAAAAIFALLGVSWFWANPKIPLSRVHVIGFAAVIAFIIYVILDTEYPRLGLLQLD